MLSSFKRLFAPEMLGYFGSVMMIVDETNKPDDFIYQKLR